MIFRDEKKKEERNAKRVAQKQKQVFSETDGLLYICNRVRGKLYFEERMFTANHRENLAETTFKKCFYFLFFFLHFDEIHQPARAPTHLVPASPLMCVLFCFPHSVVYYRAPTMSSASTPPKTRSHFQQSTKKTNNNKKNLPKLCPKSISMTSTESTQWQFLDMF